VLRFALATIFTLNCAAVLAGEMPKLPDNLPPLPTDYIRVGSWSGPYAGLLTGVIQHDGMAAALAAVAGYNFEAEALIGVEAQAMLTGDGEVSLAAAGRLGLISDDKLALFGLAGAGMRSDSGAFVLAGGGLELALDETWRARAQYQHAFDLSSEAGNDAVLIGLTFGF
jgi:hypothetical protein